MKFLYLLVVSFVFISTFSLGILTGGLTMNPQGSKPFVGQTKEEAASIVMPFLKEDVVFPAFSAHAVLVVDLNSDRALYEKNPFGRLLPASTTKVITALVAMDKYPLGVILTVGDFKVDGQKMGLVRGEKIAVRDLLRGLLIYSANDAAEVLAINYPGGRDKFIEAMNLKAQEIGLKDTFLNNPTGLDGEGHVTTARDLIIVSEIAMNRPFFRETVGTEEIVVKSVDGNYLHKLVNINELIGEMDGVLGVKTGWTENARENLVTYYEQEEKRIMIVVLGSQDRFGETKGLIDWSLESYEWREVEA
jgi:D-alanyl-D-alanine carboxypeptidase